MLSSVLIMNNSSTINIFYGTISRNSSRILVRSAKTDLVKKTIKKISVYPNIFGPHHDCGMCGGHGCSRCS